MARGVRRIAYVLGAGDNSNPYLETRRKMLVHWAADHDLDLCILSYEEAASLDPSIEGVIFQSVIGWDLAKFVNLLESQSRFPGKNIEMAIVDLAGFSPDMERPFTMVNLDMARVGAKAAERLLLRMREPDRSPEIIWVPPELRRLS